MIAFFIAISFSIRLPAPPDLPGDTIRLHVGSLSLPEEHEREMKNARKTKNLSAEAKGRYP
ncbi:MAG TPA: hypothetical protein VM238_00065, partial [Phycisphaerae bacterium]|nr:hypothetical protein [Phycisphaerae bacterium]